MGKKREKELDASCKALGFTEWECIDDPDLQDGHKNNWDVDKVAEYITNYLRDH